jgi:Lar family restriction alleviation protein
MKTYLGKLKPCPFCGSERLKLHQDSVAIYCKDCPGGVEDWEIGIEELIKAWNTRLNEDSSIE